jgi:hypothetical protein
MPKWPGVPVRGAHDIEAWRAALRTWLDLLFGDAAAQWSVTVTERTPEQYKSSKRRDDVKFFRTHADGNETAYRTFDAVNAVAQARGKSSDFLIDAATRVSGERRRRERRGSGEEESEEEETPSPVVAKKTVFSQSRATRGAMPPVAPAPAAFLPARRPRVDNATVGPTRVTVCTVTLLDGRTVTLRQDTRECVHHVWRSLRAHGVSRQGHVLAAMLRPAVEGGPPVRFNVADAQPLDELLPMDDRGAPLPGAGVVMRVLREGD